mmetsp:Transcript_44743/g.118696  ORF Transcript_44743/g.118696 Transcript_44743/m.118696 type:complete len:102 (-) Transcript_44743:613-918(-)
MSVLQAARRTYGCHVGLLRTAAARVNVQKAVVKLGLLAKVREIAAVVSLAAQTGGRTHMCHSVGVRSTCKAISTVRMLEITLVVSVTAQTGTNLDHRTHLG